jgi:hypothetical protein
LEDSVSAISDLVIAFIKEELDFRASIEFTVFDELTDIVQNNPPSSDRIDDQISPDYTKISLELLSQDIKLGVLQVVKLHNKFTKVEIELLNEITHITSIAINNWISRNNTINLPISRIGA